MDLPHLPHDLLLGLVLLGLALGLVQTARLAYRSFAVRRRLALARERGAAGEVRAEALLRRLGFSILGRQVAARYGLGVDGEEITVDLRADYLVGWGGRRFVAEVKTGALAPRIETTATRRQLLEYRVAFAVDGVLLVDADAGRVRRVDFPLPAAAPRPSRLVWLLIGAASGALATLAARGL